MTFYRAGMGTDAPWTRFMAIVPWIAVYAVTTLVIAGIGLAARTPRGRRVARSGAVLLAVALSAAAWQQRPAAWFSGEAFGPWWRAARPLPVVMAVFAAAAFTRLVTRRESRATLDRVLQLSTIMFALALLGKIILNARIYHYGFALAMPATLLAVVGLVDWLPAWVRRWGGDAGAGRAAALGVI